MLLAFRNFPVLNLCIKGKAGTMKEKYPAAKQSMDPAMRRLIHDTPVMSAALSSFGNSCLPIGGVLPEWCEPAVFVPFRR